MRFIAVFLSVFCATLAAPPTSATAYAQTNPIDIAPPGVVQSATPSEANPATQATPPPVPAAPEVAATPLPPTTVAQAFQNGLAAFQKSDFKTARVWFRETLAKDPSQIVAWYDLGLTESRLGNAGLAMAFWRKALVLSPSFSQAKHALTYTRNKLEHADIPHDVEMWETLHADVLVYGSLVQFSFFTAIVFFMAAWFALKFIGARRRAILDEKPLPPFPAVASILSLAFVTLFALTICKIVDDADLRATVIVKKIEAKALPDTTSTALFDLFEGLEVIVRQTRKEWVQVTYPGGATGWIPRAALFTNADRFRP
jgi:tetratricopeptide (TPR) repeat protein